MDKLPSAVTEKLQLLFIVGFRLMKMWVRSKVAGNGPAFYGN